jgi:hypothetical protein
MVSKTASLGHSTPPETSNRHLPQLSPYSHKGRFCALRKTDEGLMEKLLAAIQSRDVVRTPFSPEYQHIKLVFPCRNEEASSKDLTM